MFQETPEKFYTVKEVAKILGLKEWWIHRAINKRLIPSYALTTKRKLVRLSEVLAFIEKNRIGGVE